MKKIIIKGLLPLVLVVAVFHSCVNDIMEGDTHATALENEEGQLFTSEKSEVIPGQYIVVFEDSAVPILKAEVNRSNYDQRKSEMSDFAQSFFTEKNVNQKEILQSYVKTIKGVALQLSDSEVASLKKDKRVKYVEQDQTVHITMGGPPSGGDPPQSTPWGVTRVGGAINGTDAGTAWILDSGIDLDHPDLNVNVGLSVSFLSGGGGNTSPDDYNGHGTHVAGTVAAIDNSIGVIGVAAGATVVAVRVLDRKGSGSISGVIAGVDYVGANAGSGDAANMSLTGGGSTALDNAVIVASGPGGCNCPFALAAGNNSSNANNYSPARANGTNIYTVSSMTSTDNWSSFSNYGNPPVDYCAPGSSIPSLYKNGGYATLSGTSMASPHVCGILLIGGITSDGTVNGDPDGNPDPIAHH